MYKDVIDFSAEWRYYGADDNNNSDPTRCGMPINPLLVESSYGCKVMCGRSASYQMRKLRDIQNGNPCLIKKNQNMMHSSKIITLIARNAGIPKIIIDDAIRYFDKISEAKTFRGLNRDGLPTFNIISFSINKNPRTSREIASIFNLDNTSLQQKVVKMQLIY